VFGERQRINPRQYDLASFGRGGCDRIDGLKLEKDAVILRDRYEEQAAVSQLKRGLDLISVAAKQK
jgi:hypothetical protein